MKIGIILTGIIEEYYLNDIINCYKNILDNENYDIIISTWKYTDEKIISVLKHHNFQIVLSEFPEDIDKSSVNYQHFSFLVALEKIRSNNCTHVIRLRSDIFVTNMHILLKIYETMYCEKPIYLTMFNHEEGYLLDYLFMYDIYFYEKFTFKYKHQNDNRFPEKYLQEVYFGTSDWNILKEKVTLSIRELINNDIQVFFLKSCYREQGNLLVRYLHHGILE
jgi:hypothetical protein